MNKILFLISLLLSLNSINAAVLGGNFSKLNSEKRTHLFIVGKSGGLGTLLYQSAEVKARLLKDLYPNDQILILTNNDDKNLVKNSSLFKLIDSTSGGLKESYIEDVVSQLKEIASVDIYAHSNVNVGAILDETFVAFYTISEHSSVWPLVKKKLKPTSYVMIHGCNSAVRMAPELAKILNVAVLGSLTSTDFQYVYENDQWMHDYNAKDLKKKKSDRRVRLKPDNNAYRGYWGDWRSGGFPSFKTFCGNLERDKCAQSALQAMLTYPSINSPKNIKSKEDFKTNLFDFLCPNKSDGVLFKECKDNLEKSLISNEADFYTPFKGVTLNCSFEKCEARFECSALQLAFDQSACKLINENTSPSDAFVNEFKFYLEAYEQEYSDFHKL